VLASSVYSVAFSVLAPGPAGYGRRPASADGTKPEAFPLLGFGGNIITPSSSEYGEHKGVFNLSVDSAPSLISFCSGENDVGVTLSWAEKRADNKGIRVRSGGHSYEGFSVGTDVTVIDVSKLNEIEIDPDGFVSVGSGVKLGDLVEKLALHGFVLPTGSCPSVGVSGLTLGGGHGTLSRMYGLLCDSLEEVDLVLASGKKATASASENADLFWACQGGGGGNFGIVTRFKFRIYPLKNVVRYKIRWAPEHAENILILWQQWLAERAANISSTLELTFFDGAVSGIHISGISTQEVTECNELLDLLCKEHPPSEREAISCDYLAAARYFWGGKAEPVHFKATSDYVYSAMSIEAIRCLMANGQLETARGGSVAVIFDGYGGAIASKSSSETAFFHRKALYCIQYYSEWSSPSATTERSAMVLGVRQSMDSFFQPRRAYVNYCDLSIADWKTAYYGDNYARLAQVKSKYDPENQITHPQGIEPA
jgi:FAD/FMN-containing dehydrogenase